MLSNKSKFYAQLNDQSVVQVVSDLKGEVEASHMIELPFYDVSKMGNLYDPATKTFTPTSETPPRFIGTQEFFRRLTSQERQALRGTKAAVRDVKEDLDRGGVVELGDTVRDLLLASEIFTPERIDELLS